MACNVGGITERVVEVVVDLDAELDEPSNSVAVAR
ncbi:hypothetical protein ABH940_001742 [Streptacidiphilus sp. BW17]|jgi:hypothetical protein